MNTENYISSIIEITNKVQKVEPNDDLFAKINNKIAVENRVNYSYRFSFAASILVLISLSFLIFNFSKKETNNEIIFVPTQNNQLY